MYDFIVETISVLFKNGLSLSSLGAVVFLILKQRKMKRRLRRVFPWMFSDDHEVTAYMGNQRRIMDNQERIMRHIGVEPCGDTEKFNGQDRTILRPSWISSLAEASREKPKGRVKVMNWVKNINKSILVPFFSAIALFVKQVFGYEIPDEWIDGVANFVLFLVMWAGLFIRPKKDDKAAPGEYYH